MVRALKVIGLGTLFTLLWVLTAIGIGIVQTLSKPLVPATHATGLSAVPLNPYLYLIPLVSFGLAYWLVRK